MIGIQQALESQKRRNRKLLSEVQFLGPRISSRVLPMELDIRRLKRLSTAQEEALVGLQIQAARTAIRSLASLAEIGELDHLGGGLDLIPPLLLTLAVTDYEGI